MKWNILFDQDALIQIWWKTFGCEVPLQAQRSLLVDTNRTTSSTISKYDTIMFPNQTPFSQWLHLEILCVTTPNKIWYKGESYIYIYLVDYSLHYTQSLSKSTIKSLIWVYTSGQDNQTSTKVLNQRHYPHSHSLPPPLGICGVANTLVFSNWV